MQPRLLSLEPLMLVSLVVLVGGVLPAVCLCVGKAKLPLRVTVAGLASMGLAAYFFWLGQAVGRSKAWYHWRSEYQQPLKELQFHLNEIVERKDVSTLEELCRRFGKENIQAYGREELFAPSPFSQFVRRETGYGRVEPPAVGR